MQRNVLLISDKVLDAKVIQVGCGINFTWKEVEIVGRPKPGVHLSGRTAAFAERVNAGPIDLSMTHSREIAAAIAVVAPRE